MQCSKTWFESKGIKAVIFDFDGTLYDNSKLAAALIKARPLSSLRMLADRRARKALKGSYFENEEGFLQEYAKIAASKCFCRPSVFLSWYQKKYMPLMVEVMKKKCRARADVNQILTELKNLGIKRAVLSDYPLVKERMSAIGLSDASLDFIRASQELGGLKPAATLFEKVAGELGVQAGQVLVVGDRDDTDGQGARNAGMFYHIINRESQATSFFQYLPFAASDDERF